MSDSVSGRKQVCKSSEEFFDYICDPCKTAGDNAEAQGFCTNCEEYLCGTCFRSHSRSKLSKHHTLLDKDDMPRKTSKLCDPCHASDEKIEAVGYCKNCNECLCSGCYKSHSRSKVSRNHVLVDKAKTAEESDNTVTTSIAKMEINEKHNDNQKCLEEYDGILDISVKADADEKDCFIVGMTLVSNTELVISDGYNNSLKLIDLDNSKIKDVLVVGGVPCGITTVSKDQVAVTLDNKYQIQIISIPGGLSVVRTIKTSGNGLGVTFINEQLLASFRGPVQFQLLQLTGAISKTIKPDSEVLKHCVHPRHIAVSSGEKLIYVSDWKMNKVFTMDIDGKLVSLYQAELDHPYGLVISPFGSVYLCNREQHVVYKMTPDLSEATVMLGPADGLNSPHALCFNPDKKASFGKWTLCCKFSKKWQLLPTRYNYY